MSRRSLCVLLVAIACGDDGGGTGTSVGTSATAGVSTGEDTSSTTADTSEGSEGSSSSEGSGGSGGSDSGSSGGSSGSGGPVGDPLYPPLQDGMCPGGEVPTMLPGGSVCAPFCQGESAECPDAATGDATPTCTPFERDGSGSGDPCERHDTCPRDEACGIEGTCIAVAFWACRLQCAGGQTCPDPMECTSIGTCGYP